MATLTDVPYGTHARQVLDFYLAESETPTPVLFFIHGGGWLHGGKHHVKNFAAYLAAGISVVTINYRFVGDAEADGLQPPVKGPLHDAARALQFVRRNANDWHLDKQRICSLGISAGGSSSLWLAFHADLADAANADPIARESTRLWCAATIDAQTTLDPQQMVEWTPNSTYGAHAFGIHSESATKQATFAEFLDRRPALLPWIGEYSPYALVSADDPPVYLSYTNPPEFGQPEDEPNHTANFGVGLLGRCLDIGATCQLVYPGAQEVEYSNAAQYIIAKLTDGAALSGMH